MQKRLEVLRRADIPSVTTNFSVNAESDMTFSSSPVVGRTNDPYIEDLLRSDITGSTKKEPSLLDRVLKREQLLTRGGSHRFKTRKTDYALWAEGAVNFGFSRNKSEQNVRTAEVTIGVDKAIFGHKTRAGLSVGFGNSQSKLHMDEKVQLDMSTAHLSVYGSHKLSERFFLELFGSYGFIASYSQRWQSHANVLMKGYRSGRQAVISASLSGEWPIKGDHLVFSPYVRARYALGHLVGYKEAGPESYALKFSPIDIHSSNGVLGTRLMYNKKISGLYVTSFVRGEYGLSFIKQGAQRIGYASFGDVGGVEVPIFNDYSHRMTGGIGFSLMNMSRLFNVEVEYNYSHYMNSSLSYAHGLRSKVVIRF